MQSVSTLIEFLMHLLRDEHAQAQFEQNPQAALAARGLDNVTGQDVRDARLIMADDDAVHPRHGARSHHSQSDNSRSGHDDPVREIRHTTRNYQASEHGAADGGYHYTADDVNQTFTILNIDDRDTLIVDSFNSDDDGIDNKGGDISESVLAGDDLNGQVGVDNSDTTDVDVLAINKSFNEDNSTSTDVDILSIKDSFNKATATTPAPGAPPAADQPATDQPATEQPATEQPAADQPAADQSAADQSAADQPPAGPPAVDPPAAGDHAAGDHAAEDPSVDDPTVEDPIADHPIADDPVAVDPEPDVPVDEPDLDSADHAII